MNLAVGDTPGTLQLLENRNADMSSLLKPGKAAWGEIIRETPVEVTTVDLFLQRHLIKRVDVLKTDTQGHDLAVLRGAEATISDVRVVLAEITFVAMYEGAPRFDRLLSHMLDRDFQLAGLYVTHQNGQAAWADALFVRS